MRTQALRRTRLVVATSAVAAAALTGCSGSDDAATDAGTTDSAASTPSTPSSPAPDADATYEDGTYEARGTYGGGPSFLDVTVEIEDGIITDVEIGTPATNPTSLEYQEAFAAAVPDEVIGKDLSEVRVGKLAGSSGTPDGFNDAIEQIREQALTAG
jgi:uncharacterized protein with FMN-binding domain